MAWLFAIAWGNGIVLGLISGVVLAARVSGVIVPIASNDPPPSLDWLPEGLRP